MAEKVDCADVKIDDGSRDKWKKKIDFAFSIAGGFVGLGNVWRFPYLCFKNGGGAFLIPYVLFVCVGALPVFFLEVTVGQYTNLGGALAWKITPVMSGIGIACNMINYYLNVYYAVILAWSLRYFFASMSSQLPWATCGNGWNTEHCFVFGSDSNVTSGAMAAVNSSFLNASQTTAINSTKRISSVLEYWNRGVLGVSPGIEYVGNIKWELLLCLMLTWLVIYFCIWKGIGWTSKVVYFTATFPLIMMLVLLVRGLTLDGASDGVVFYLKPDFNRMKDVQVWLDAATQVFYSYALCKGMLVTMGSYNKYHYNSYRDCIFLSILNSGVSFISGFAIFAVLGFMAKEQGVKVADVVASGPGLAFIAYPKALTMMPFPQFWGCLFFFMLFLLGLDSEFVGQETLMSALVDLKPAFFKKPWRREGVLALLSLSQFLLGVIMVSEGGVYYFNIFDNYAAAGWCLLIISFFQVIAVSWIFGIDKFWDKVCEMIGYRPFPWFKWCWFVISPISIAGLCFFSILNYKPLRYNKIYVYPTWGLVLAWMLALSSILWVPGVAIYKLLRANGTFMERWASVSKSEFDDSKRAGREIYEQVNTSPSDKEAEMQLNTANSARIEDTPMYDDVVNNQEKYAAL